MCLKVQRFTTRPVERMQEQEQYGSNLRQRRKPINVNVNKCVCFRWTFALYVLRLKVETLKLFN